MIKHQFKFGLQIFLMLLFFIQKGTGNIPSILLQLKFQKMADKVGYLLMLIALITLPVSLNAQDLNCEKDRQIEQIVESLASSDDGESDNPQILDDLTKYAENPLNINTATADELARLNLVDYRQIQNILGYRKKYGFILSPYELNAVEGLTPWNIKALEPFISFIQPSDAGQVELKKIFQKVIVRGRTSLPLAKGYSSVSEKKPAVYPGIPFGLYSRYNVEIPGKLEAGFTIDHDAGEELFRGSNQMGFDYYSGFISWQSKSYIQQFTIGDYYLKFGQGLSFWSGSGIGKSSNAVNIMKSGQGIRPYSSTDENLFFRGIATVIGKGPLKLMLFYSNKKRDANIVTDKNSGERQFTSLKTGGYHRTGSEIEDEKILREQDAGVYGELRLNRLRLGALFSYQHFAMDMTTGTAAYKSKSFTGNENLNLGVDYQLALHRLQLFGETGVSMNKKPAVIQGLIWNIHPQLSLSIYYRYFDPGFHAFYGNPLSEGTEGRNERGIYTGVELYPFEKVKISFYADYYHFPWLTYSTLAPSNGRDYMIQLDYSLLKNLEIYVKGKFEIKPKKYTSVTGNSSDCDESVKRLRLQCEWKVTHNLLLKNRFEYAGYSFNSLKENGFLIYQDFDFSPFPKLNLWIRYAWFHTDGYNSRIYTYENDLLYNFAIPEFHGKGNRIYLNLKWRASKDLTTCFKAGYTLHQGVDSWGSGYDLTKGNYRTEYRAEACLRF
jgi:hypothetical protein